jgi:hypothetical protein
MIFFKIVFDNCEIFVVFVQKPIIIIMNNFLFYLKLIN